MLQMGPRIWVPQFDLTIVTVTPCMNLCTKTVHRNAIFLFHCH